MKGKNHIKTERKKHMSSILRELARFAVELDAEKIPPEVREAASLKILDTVAAGIGAARNEQILRVTG